MNNSEKHSGGQRSVENDSDRFAGDQRSTQSSSGRFAGDQQPAESNSSDRFANDPHAHVVYKPVVPRSDAQQSRKQSSRTPDPFIRAENEDDDGYDPYSDRREETPLFEANPWD